jgi:hypothetical protein
MPRYLPPLCGLAVLLSAGVVHGLWTERWSRSAELDAAVARLGRLPDDFAPWQSGPAEAPEGLTEAGARGFWTRQFRDKSSGEAVLVILMCGRPGQMAVHRPEHCYQAAGYELVGPAQRVQVPLPEARAELWTALFRKEEADGPAQVRVYWTWFADSAWLAPDSPRLAFARYRALYKLYVIRTVTTPPAAPAADPCVALVRRLLPDLARLLSP